MKKTISLVFLFVLLSLSPLFISNGYSKEQSNFVNYRNSLIKYQPQFTVEGQKMITRREAQNNMNESKADDKALAVFQTSEFEWYYWYEEQLGYTRYSPIKTVMAKFPKNSDMAQTSYSLFSFQGYWKLDGVHNNIFRFLDFTNYNGGTPDQTYPAMMFTQHIDFPLLFEEQINSRYAFNSTTWCYDTTTLRILQTTDSTANAKYRVITYSLLDGDLIEKTDYKKVDEEFTEMQNSCTRW